MNTSTNATRQAETLDRFIQGWTAWSPDAWLAIFSNDLVHVTLPYSLEIPARNKAQVDSALPAMMSAVEDIKVHVHNVVHDAKRNKAAVYVTSTGKTSFGPWNMEYAVFLSFSDDGREICKIEEMLDSREMVDLGPKLGKFIQQQKMHAANHATCAT